MEREGEGEEEGEGVPDVDGRGRARRARFERGARVREDPVELRRTTARSLCSETEL